MAPTFGQFPANFIFSGALDMWTNSGPQTLQVEETGDKNQAGSSIIVPVVWAVACRGLIGKIAPLISRLPTP